MNLKNTIIISLLLSLFSGQTFSSVIGYAGGGQPRGLYEIDTNNGVANFTTSVDYFLATGGLAYLGGSLYATNFTTSPGTTPPETYGLLNPINGAFTALGTQTSANWYGLTANENSNFLYVMDIEDSILRKFTPGGAIETIGTGIGINIVNGIRGMAYDDLNGILYATDYYDADANLYTIDTSTGLASLVGSLGLPATQGGGHIPLAYDEDNKVLYAADSVARSIYTVNINSGEATSIGVSGVPFGSLTWSSDLQPVPVPPALPMFFTGLLFIWSYRKKKA